MSWYRALVHTLNRQESNICREQHRAEENKLLPLSVQFVDKVDPAIVMQHAIDPHPLECAQIDFGSIEQKWGDNEQGHTPM